MVKECALRRQKKRGGEKEVSSRTFKGPRAGRRAPSELEVTLDEEQQTHGFLEEPVVEALALG